MMGLAGPLTHSEQIITAVATDSRRLLLHPESTIFVALRTPSGDGHRYVAEMLRRGVGAFVVERIPDGIDPSAAHFLVVPSALGALQQWAAAHRRLCIHTTVVAVGGSRGKTMVKEEIYRLLSQHGPAVRSPRSYNSQVGVALSLLGIDPDRHRYAVIEAGVSRSGEMATLERMIAPDMAVITNVTEGEHADGFESFEQKRAEKLLLGSRARITVAPAPLPATMQVELPHPADFADCNGRLAATAVQALGLEVTQRPLPQWQTRLDVTDGVNNCLIITDAFSCDLTSLELTLDFMNRRRTSARHATLLVDDLGPDEATYRRLAELMRLYGVNRLIGCGPGFAAHSSVLPAEAAIAVMPTAAECAARMSRRDFSGELLVVKAEPDSALHSLAESLRSRHNETVLEVNLDAVIHNFNHYRAMLRPGTGVVAMVKASGYGAGAYELAKTLQSQGAAYLAVAVTDEGEELRRAGITMPIMVMNPKATDYDALFALHLEPEIFSLEMLAEVIAEGRRRGITGHPVHIKFDTGMHRLGFLPGQLAQLGAMLRATDTVSVRSVFSHLATADCPDQDDYTLQQLHTFDSMCAMMEAEIGPGFLRHVLNSAGIARFPQWQYDMVRLGIGLYGIDTLGIEATWGLRPVSALRSIIISVKEWPAGTSIGYARRTVLTRPSRVATVPLGYADGLNRRLGNRCGRMWVDGTPCPIVGNVCMDACMVDITDAPATVGVGHPVEIFGPHIPVSTVADIIGTIPYEVLTSVSPRVKRVYYRE